MKNETEKSLYEKYEESKMKASIINSIIEEIADKTKDIDFKLLNITTKVQNKINKLSDIDCLQNFTSRDKNKVINFLRAN